MLFLLSPAKSLDFSPPPPGLAHTSPVFARDAAELIGVLRQKSPQQIAGLMQLSDALAVLNVARYEAWRVRATASLGADDLAWAQQHLCILSGLYGVLRPLDRIQPHRLEMGTRLATDRGDNLYRFWGTRIAEHLNRLLAADRTPVLVNLASQEYFKSVDRSVLKGRVIECVFEEGQDGHFKVVSFFAKRARGLMARFATQHRISTPRQLGAFDLEGYAHAPAASAPDRLVFRRSVA
jgi:cytoplasmic iron level regulating protein YaaA (DUF328/UPF0246 family)